ncbi:MAG: hypothetical protein ACPGJS_15230 [Flammeovirgaceae bacterium]
MKIQELDQFNWGVCGFIAAIQGAVSNGKRPDIANRISDICAYQKSNNPTEGEKDDRKSKTHKIIFPIIEKFYNDHNTLHKELRDFTKAFGEEHNRALDDIIADMKKDRLMSQGLGLAMTATAMTKLVEDLGFKESTFIGTTSQNNTLEFPYANTIYGLGNSKRLDYPKNYRFGLLHWIYVDESRKIFSWGKIQTLKNLEDQGYNKVTHYLNNLR